MESRKESPNTGQEVLDGDARAHLELEHTLTIRQAIRYHKPAIFWCLAVSMTVVMEGYDTILIGNFWAYPTFQKKYGEYVGVGDTTPSGYQISPSWQAGLSNAGAIGAFCGGLLNGILVDRFGQKNTLVGSLIALSCFIFIVFFASSPQMLFAGELLSGVPWGVFATSSPAYASEMLPMVLRVYLTSWTNMCFIIGQLIAAGVLRACLVRDDEWGYRIPFALQWFWPLCLMPLLCFAPESPWHLVRKGRTEEAEQALGRLRAPDSPTTGKQALAAIVHTNRIEEELSITSAYKDCFKGVECCRTEIACVTFAGQLLCGMPIAYNATYFYEQIGLPSSVTYNINIAGYGLALFAAFCSWFILMPRIGRRRIYLCGAAAMSTILYLVGTLTFWKQIHGVAQSQAYLLMIWKFVFQLSAGQLGWAIPAEVGSTKLRQKTIILARNAYYIIHIVSNFLQPYLINPKALNLGARTAFIWAGTGSVFLLWAFFRLPETKGRTFEELDHLFAHRIPPRKFADTELDGMGDKQVARSA